MEKKRRLFSSIRFKMMVAIAFLIALIMMGVNGVISGQVRKTMLGESLDKGLAIAKNLSVISEEAILTQDDTALFVPLRKSVTESRGITYAFVSDNNGSIIAHNDVKMVDSTYNAPKAIEVLASTKDHKIMSYMAGDMLVYDISALIGGGERLGFVHIGLASSTIDEVVENTSRNILMMTLFGLVAGGLGAFILASFQVKPILMLVEGVRAIGEGNLEQRIDIKRKDEIGDLTTAFNQMAEGLQEREFIRQTFQKFVHKDVADELLKNPDMIKVGGERRKATIIFTDIRGFTAISERLSPEEVIKLLNDYFAVLLPIVDRNGGVLDKFIGDAMMIVFGTPVQKDDDSLRAVRTGVEMKAAVKELNEVRAKEGKETIILGIGINTGNIVAGNVGSEDRMEYTHLGDAVNVAARLEGLSRTGDVIVSEDTYNEVKDKVDAKKGTEKVSLKGKSVAVEIYRINRLL